MCSGDHKKGLDALDAEAAAAREAFLNALAHADVAPHPKGVASLRAQFDDYETATNRRIIVRDAVIADLLDMIQQKDEELHDHRRQRFGQKSEKDTGRDSDAPAASADPPPSKSPPPDQTDGGNRSNRRSADEAGDAGSNSEAGARKDGAASSDTKPGGPKRRGAREGVTPDEELHHEPESMICAFCGGNLRIKGYDDALRRSIVEAHIKTIMEKYAITSCDGCERVEQVQRVPNLFSGTSCDASLFAGIAVQKFAASTSLYTLDSVIFANFDGADRSYMSRVLSNGAEKISDLWAAFEEHILAQPYIALDETPLPVLGITEGKAHKGYGFAMMTGGSSSADAPPAAVFFKYSNTRTGAFAEEMLKGFNGACTADKFPGYLRFCKIRTQEGLRVKLMFCHAHARRNFEKLAKSNKSPIAKEMVKFYKRLYAIEKTIRGATDAERARVRRAKALPILREMRQYMILQRGRISQTGKLADAIVYILDHFREFRRYCFIGSASIDNNSLERTIRRWTVTRRSSLFAGSLKGAMTWSILSSVIETCKLHGVDPFRYLTWYCRKKAAGGASFDPKQHFPWQFKTHPDYETFKASELPRNTMLKSQRAVSAVQRAEA